MQREFLEGLRVGEEALPAEVVDAIMAEHESALQAVRFEGALRDAITRARGRNAKAITALLDVDALKAAPEGLDSALKALKKENSYLFEEEPLPPVYAKGTGATPPENTPPMTLAGALRERFERSK